MTGKRFTYRNTYGWDKDGFLNTMNGLNEKNKKLQKENEQLKRRNKKLEKHLRKFYSDEEWKLREALGDFE